MTRAIYLLILGVMAGSAYGQWRAVSEFDSRQSFPDKFPSGGKEYKVGDEWPKDQRFRWLIADLEIPEIIGGQPTAKKAVGLQFNCGDGGEIYVAGHLQGRYDNDHPLLVTLSHKAVPHQKVSVAVQVFGTVQGGGKLDEAKIVLLPADRTEAVSLSVNAETKEGIVPNGLIGLSQGGGMSDYDDATAAKLKEGGFKWFRMDNVLTSALKKDEQGKFVYDWSDFDRRLDFMYKVGAEPIFAASYMPQVLDAVPNNDRQSAPNDYEAWEELCYQAAKRGLERGKRVHFWEVWNEANTGWIKPGPNDTGPEEFKTLYQQAIGQDEPNHEIVRRFEAYAKVYRATARGVRQADPQAKVGGPALASGPFEQTNCDHCRHGKGFARGLMLWCDKENLPLDFVSWHEYFQAANVIAKEADAFRQYLDEFPKLRQSVKSLMITEWNEAWWPNRPHDHEIAAAWCAHGMIRTMIPKKIDRPCLFYVKQGDMSFRGDWSILMHENRPKPTFNMARIFNSLSGEWVKISGGDDDVCALAAFNSKQGRLAVVLVNFRDRYSVARQVRLKTNNLPSAFVGGTWQESVIDSLHSNVFTDPSRCELEISRQGSVENEHFTYDVDMMANAVILLELTAKDR
jgi:Glycosyl hydrolases family 39